jgi:hypothetical protein
MKKVMEKLFLPLILVVIATPAAALLTDDEPANDSIATAPIQMDRSQAVDTVTTDGGEFSLTVGNNDFIGISGMLPGDIIEVVTTPLEDPPVFEIPDTVLGLFNSATTDPTTMRLCIGDDAGNNDLDLFLVGFGSMCRLQLQFAGTYYLGITGLSSGVPFDGTHLEAGNYAVAVTVIPEPGLILQLISGGVGLGWLHRRRTLKVRVPPNRGGRRPM